MNENELMEHRLKRYRMLAERVKMERSRQDQTETSREYNLAEAVTWLLDERSAERERMREALRKCDVAAQYIIEDIRAALWTGE